MPELFSALDWRPLAAALLKVLDDNRQQGRLSGFTAEAAAWVVSDKLRADLHQRVSEEWCRQAHQDFTCFPYAIDYVAKLYLQMSRLNQAALEQLSEARPRRYP